MSSRILDRLFVAPASAALIAQEFETTPAVIEVHVRALVACGMVVAGCDALRLTPEGAAHRALVAAARRR